MIKIFGLLLLTLAISSADIAEDVSAPSYLDEQYLLVPLVYQQKHSRDKRQLKKLEMELMTMQGGGYNVEGTPFSFSRSSSPFGTNSNSPFSLSSPGNSFTNKNTNFNTFNTNFRPSTSLTSLNSLNNLNSFKPTSISSPKRGLTEASLSNTGFDISHTQTFIDNSRHKFDGSAMLSKPFPGPLSTSGSLNYLHKPSDSSASISASHTAGEGTKLGAEAEYNFIRSKNGMTTGSVSGSYNQQLGGPNGNQKPEIEGMINFKHRF